MKITNGTWKMRKQNDLNYVVGNKNGLIGAISGDTPESSFANARLISYAPEMYEVLQQIRECLIAEGKLKGHEVEDVAVLLQELKTYYNSLAQDSQ